MNATTDVRLRNLEDLFVRELEEMYDAEHRIGTLLFNVATAASCWKLKRRILDHQLEAEGHVMKLEQVFECFDRRTTGKTSKITIGFVEECGEIAKEFAGSPAINAALISFLKKVGHYEIAAYESLLEWAALLRYPEAGDMLEEILGEKNSAVQTFSELARSSSNEDALMQPDWEDEMQEDQKVG